MWFYDPRFDCVLYPICHDRKLKYCRFSEPEARRFDFY